VDPLSATCLQAAFHSGPRCDPDKRAPEPYLSDLRRYVSPFVRERFKGLVKWDEPVLAEGCMYSQTPDEVRSTFSSNGVLRASKKASDFPKLVNDSNHKSVLVKWNEPVAGRGLHVLNDPRRSEIDSLFD
jgi:hypothetical protein